MPHGHVLKKNVWADGQLLVTSLVIFSGDVMMANQQMRLYCAIVSLFVVPVGSVLAEQMRPMAGTNLLSGKEANFSVTPNYDYCKGGDETDLTDGKYWQSGGQTGFWTDKGTVGWGVGRFPGAMVTFDLGEVQPIKALGFDTVAGAAQVTFPAAVFVYVSDDSKTWHYVTDLINEAIRQSSFVRHRFVASDLRTRGRYLAFYIAKGGFYAFVDEIEAIRGEHDAGAVTFGGKGIETDQLAEHALAVNANAVQKNATLYLINLAREQVEASPEDVRSGVLKKLGQLRQETSGRGLVEKVDYGIGLPYTDSDRKVCQTMGAHFGSLNSVKIMPWEPTESIWSHTTNPFARPAKAIAPELNADMMIGELEPVAFNVSNNTTQPVKITITVSDLKESNGDSIWSNSNIERRITTHVLASGYQFFDDALTPFADDEITIPAGMTRQVWLILNSGGVKAGQYSGTVTVTGGAEKYQIPLTATVYPLAMPKNPAYTSVAWSYFTWKPAKGYEKQAAAELERTYQNAHVLHHRYIPWPKVGKETKKMLRPVELDFTGIDEMISYRPYVRQWLLWPGFEFGYMSLNYYGAIDMPKVGTPEHEKLFKEWVRQIRDHMKEKGFRTDRWAFYWTDEPGTERFLDFIVPASKMAKEVDSTILVWEDPSISLELLEKYPEAIDIYCFPLDWYRSNPDTLKYVLAGKFPGLHYLCGSAKANDPHQYYRLHHMASVALGLDGAGMWVWGDDGGQFNDYEGQMPSYGMVYATEDGPITGKRREAWREGIEDAELWRHLKIKAEITGSRKLKQLYEQTPARLLYKGEETTGEHTGTPEDLMKTRLEILQSISNTMK